MRVEPEHMLEQNGVSTERGIEDSNLGDAFHRNHYEGDGQYWRIQNEDQAVRVHRPDENRQLEPGEAWRAHAMNGYDEVQGRQDRRESGDKHPGRCCNHISRGVTGTEGRVKRPTGINTATDQGVNRYAAS